MMKTVAVKAKVHVESCPRFRNCLVSCRTHRNGSWIARWGKVVSGAPDRTSIVAQFMIHIWRIVHSTLVSDRGGDLEGIGNMDVEP